ncbi:MAG: glycoside hydrolase family 88 protein [Oscillospiraceae bacterium]|nr:glycoside hydrolase family 88 protein [Oscillospiraceae bacterium]
MAKTIMNRYPNANDFPYRSWCYPQGFMLWGFIRLYEKTGEQKYLDYIMGYCDFHVTEQGDVPAFTGNSLDDIMAGSVLVWAFARTGKEKYRLACEKVRAAFNDYPRNSDGGFWHGRGLPSEMWVDGLFMGLMFLTRYGAFCGDKEYCFDETVRQLSIAFDRCEKDGSGLLYHGYSENRRVSWAHPITGKAQEIWCEGLGWYAMILVDVLEILPKTHAGYDRLYMQLRKLVDGLLKVQDSTSGLWYQVVDKPRYPRNWHDTSGSAMFLYCIKKAGLLGLIDKDKCDRAAAKAFSGIKTKCIVDYEGNADIFDACDGLCIQDNYDIYVGYAKNVNSKEAIAAFFWAALIMERGL